jgi:hypothetical protein
VKFIDYFKEKYSVQNLGEVTFAHAVNSKEKLLKYQDKSGAMILDFDILLSSHNTLIAAHPPIKDSDLTVEEILQKMQSSHQVIKFDFKDPNAVQPTLTLLKKYQITQPVILNADIVKGYGAHSTFFNPTRFISTCQSLYPQGVLSLGWTTEADLENQYSKDVIKQMYDITKSLQEIIYPVRACLLPNCWKDIQLLLSKGRILNIWTGETVTEGLSDWIKIHTNPDNTLYDL